MTEKTEKATTSKAAELVEAAKKRRELEQANSTQPPKTVEERFSDEELAQLKKDAEVMAAAKVQAKAGTMTGKLDVEAMGDVKGDGGDAADYDDGDPDKALGVPTYIHGLHETREGVDTVTAVAKENHVSARTRAEQQRGKDVISGRAADREKAQASSDRVVVKEVPVASTAKTATTVEDAGIAKAPARDYSKK